jgi:hypothetical protein
MMNERPVSRPGASNMMRRTAALASALCSIFLVADVVAATPTGLSAAQILERNSAARGGLAAWRSVQTIAYSGHLQAGGQLNTELPFTMTMKRPRNSRFELQFAGHTAVQVYDGAHGWKVRPFLGRDDVEPFSSDELKTAAKSQDLDGVLIDAAAKGNRVDVEATEPVEGHSAYRLKVTLRDGTTRHVWVDTQSFLEVKLDGEPRRLNGRMHSVAVYCRDYRAVNGLMIPYVLETAVEGVRETHKMTIDKVVLNPVVGAGAFARPGPLLAANSPARVPGPIANKH